MPEWPFDDPDTLDLGHGIALRWDPDEMGFIWHHPACRPWASLRLKPDPASTGHQIVSGGPDNSQELTIEGSLLCPMGCGTHGIIRCGRWEPS